MFVRLPAQLLLGQASYYASLRPDQPHWQMKAELLCILGYRCIRTTTMEHDGSTSPEAVL